MSESMAKDEAKKQNCVNLFSVAIFFWNVVTNQLFFKFTKQMSVLINCSRSLSVSCQIFWGKKSLLGSLIQRHWLRLAVSLRPWPTLTDYCYGAAHTASVVQVSTSRQQLNSWILHSDNQLSTNQLIPILHRKWKLLLLRSCPHHLSSASEH